MTDILSTLLADRGWLLADGGTGTGLFARGLETGDAPELWNVDEPEKIRDLHREFVEAGSDIILTNSFGCNAMRLKLHNAEDRVFELAKAGAELARTVADEADHQVIVAGSMGPTGELLVPVGALAFEDARDAFAEQARGLVAGGADILWIETMSSREELQAAIEGASETGKPVVATMTFDTAGKTMMGVAPDDASRFAGALAMAPVAFGANCGLGAGENIASVVGIARGIWPGAVIVAKANCGIPEWRGDGFVYTGTPEIMGNYARMARDAGAQIIGGCCGTRGEHLAAMRAALDGYEPGDAPTAATIKDVLGETPPGMEGPKHGASAEGDEGRRRRRRRG
jgi:5-methyltetrahydrofolate--homocysteine methyltransferase